MNWLRVLARWLDVRPAEYRPFVLSALGAFLVIAFSVVSRALREAFFIDEFSIESLPIIDLATAVLSLPAVLFFGRLLGRADPDRVFRRLVALLFVAVLTLWILATWWPTRAVELGGTVAFYMVTALGTLLLTSGFWVITSEQFALRDAKRLFGLIGGGGTLGMLAGLSVRPLTQAAGNGAPVVGLMLTLALLALLQRLLPPPRTSPTMVADERGTGTLENVSSVLRSPHLRTMAAIVAAATIASFLVDYQFKAEASVAFPDDADLAGFLGTFYGISGVAALLLQVFAASRLLNGVGVAATLSVLPSLVLLGSSAVLLAPGLAAATTVRGVDNALKKSVHRSVLEYLWVPVPTAQRRRTKTFVDSFVDSGATGLAAAAVAIWVALGFSPRALALAVIALTAVSIGLARTMGRRYLQTLVDQLAHGQGSLEKRVVQTQFAGGEMTMTVTEFDVQRALQGSGATATAPLPDEDTGTDAAPTLAERLLSPDADEVEALLEETDRWGADEVDALIRLLPRDRLFERVTDTLASMDAAPVQQLAATLLDDHADFVLRRRIPRVLARVSDASVDDVLLQGLSAGRFEVRYRCAVALARRRRRGVQPGAEAEARIWEAVRAELSRERPIWELQKLLDDRPASDDLVIDHLYGRGELSLEHTFRLLSMVLDPEPIRTAFHGIVLDDPGLRSLSLEYLEQVLPPDVRDRLWPFIGDISDHQREREIRGVDEVVADLLKTGATFFGGDADRARLREALRAEPEEEP